MRKSNVTLWFWNGANGRNGTGMAGMDDIESWNGSAEQGVYGRRFYFAVFSSLFSPLSKHSLVGYTYLDGHGSIAI